MTESIEPGFEATRHDGVLRVRRPGTEWLSTGWDGGRVAADAAYNVSVPEAWERTALDAYAADRLDRAGFDGATDGPVLFTGVGIDDARGARLGPVTVCATAGLSNPAALPMEPSEPGGTGLGTESTGGNCTEPADNDRTRGTVNLIVGTKRSLGDGALANLVAIAAEAKAATLLHETGFPGTTTDAIVVGHDPTGDCEPFSGSATAVGAATRACVREAVRASLTAHYDGIDPELPSSIADATYGVSTDERADLFRPSPSEPGRR